MSSLNLFYHQLLSFKTALSNLKNFQCWSRHWGYNCCSNSFLLVVAASASAATLVLDWSVSDRFLIRVVDDDVRWWFLWSRALESRAHEVYRRLLITAAGSWETFIHRDCLEMKKEFGKKKKSVEHCEEKKSLKLQHRLQRKSCY